MQKISLKQNINIIKKCEKVVLKYYDDLKAFIEYLNDMQDFFKRY